MLSLLVRARSASQAGLHKAVSCCIRVPRNTSQGSVQRHRIVCTVAPAQTLPSDNQSFDDLTANDLKHYQLGTLAGDAQSMLQLAICYMSGLAGLERDTSVGMVLLERAAKLGHSESLFCLGSLHCQGSPDAPVDMAEGVRLLEQAAHQEHVRALLVLASLHSNTYAPPAGASEAYPIPLDLQKAAQLLQRAADLGDAEAHFNLGMAYGAGRGVEADSKKALVLVTLAATEGHAAAQFSLAAMYMNGEIVGRDNAKGIEWLKLSADQGEPDAEYFLAQCHLEGVGCAQDTNKAVELYSSAAKRGHELAAQALANLKRRKN